MSEDSRIGTLLAGRYRIDKLLGEGGMGKVYSAEHVLMKKRLAVKVLHKALSAVPEVITRFEREAMAAAHIEHPNVAAATDFGKTEDGSVFLVLEFVEGTGLRDRIAEGPMPPERCLHIGFQIASALASAHALRIVHRDLKPDNVMLVNKGGDPDFVKVLDFGIAKVPLGDGSERPPDGQGITQAGMVFGTPEYMAPEQALGQSVDGRADIYALGVILYEMLSGTRPFVSKSHVGILGQQLSSPVPRFAERAQGTMIPPSVEQLVLKMLERERERRFQDASQAAEALAELMQAPAPQGPLFTQPGGSPRAVLGSEPEDSHPPSGSLPLPSFATESDSGLVQLPDETAGALREPPKPVPAREGPSAGAPLEATGAPGGPGWLARARGMLSLARVAGFVDSHKSRLPASMQRVPPRVLLVAFGLMGSVVLIGAFAIVAYSSRAADAPEPGAQAPIRSPSSESLAPPPQKPEKPAVQSAIEKAQQGGLEELQALAMQYPDDAQVLVALAKAQVEDKDYAAAVESVSKALELDPELNENESIASLLFMAAQSKQASPAAFQLLEGPLGARGADIVYDIAEQRGVRTPVKRRAESFLRSKAFEQASSPALNIAVALRHAKSCRQKHGLLLRAKNVGDRRALGELKPLTQRTGCGADRNRDCYRCLRQDERLEQAIAAINERHPRR